MYDSQYLVLASSWKLESPQFETIMEDRMGMTVTSGCVTLIKDDTNLIGISIGGGAPYCPCLYIVQVFDNTPASKEGTLQAGDEITGVNGATVKGKTKVEVAKIIQGAKGKVNINYNKLHAEDNQGKGLDIVMKKMKHRMVDNLSSSTADALGLSRAILCNDSLVKKLQELERNEKLYMGLLDHSKVLMKNYYDLCGIYKGFADVMAGIGVREPQATASEAFTKFSEAHRTMEKFGIKLLKKIKPMLSDLNTYLNKAVPDTQLTIKKYADAKFEYLSYCLKVKEMDDEEYTYQALQEPLYRVETGNYEYRLILRCRQEARVRFGKLRSDVLVKLELLDQKHVQDIVFQLQRLIAAVSVYHHQCFKVMSRTKIFPIEIDLSQEAFSYGEPSGGPIPYQDDSDGQNEEDEEDDSMLIQLVQEAQDLVSFDITRSTEEDQQPLSSSLNRQANIDQLISYDK